jgi:hypothetical protein
MKRSTKLGLLRLLIILVIAGLFMSFPVYPGFLVPGLLIVLVLVLVLGRLWLAYSAEIVAEARAKRKAP